MDSGRRRLPALALGWTSWLALAQWWEVALTHGLLWALARALVLWRARASKSGPWWKISCGLRDTLAWDDEFSLERAERWLLVMEYAPRSWS